MAISEYCDQAEVNMQEVLFNELKKNNIEFGTTSLIVYAEQKPKSLKFDDTPLPQRDMNTNPKILKKNRTTFDEHLDSIFVKNLKIKKPKKANEKTKKQSKKTSKN